MVGEGGYWDFCFDCWPLWIKPTLQTTLCSFSLSFMGKSWTLGPNGLFKAVEHLPKQQKWFEICFDIWFSVLLQRTGVTVSHITYFKFLEFWFIVTSSSFSPSWKLLADSIFIYLLLRRRFQRQSMCENSWNVKSKATEKLDVHHLLNSYSSGTLQLSPFVLKLCVIVIRWHRRALRFF